MKRKQYSTTISNRRTLQVFERRTGRQSRYRRPFRAIETLWRILFQTREDRVQR